MGKAPSVIIIARHGARLDIEDKTWQANSPVPYDPPLTYGGWTQSRALGARIASLLHARDLASNKDGSGVRRRSDDSSNAQNEAFRLPERKVVIHSSPYRRCCQTSIAIGAGMAQYQGNLLKFGDVQAQSGPAAPHLFVGSEKSRSMSSQEAEALVARRFEETKLFDSKLTTPNAVEPTITGFNRAILRVDAFLGEWLSPDYFENIIPPPPSKFMVAAAKAQLLVYPHIIRGNALPRRQPADQLQKPSDKHTSNSVASQPGSSDTDQNSKSQPDSPDAVNATVSNKQTLGYTPPTPTYALSTAGPIPQGYVGHARNACMDIDFQWNSMLEPQNWGDGGENGEEWSSMHKRFRKGVTDMVTWYKTNGPRKLTPDFAADNSKPDSLDDTDVILIIVTHGAGCNALIGALTGQPVLLDVGMASLTMAVRKDRVVETNLERTISGRRKSSTVDATLSQEYDMKLIASTDHLRAGVDPLKIPQLQSPRAMPSIPEHRRQMSGRSRGSSGSRTPTTPPNEPLPSKNSALGSIRRSTVNSSMPYRPNTLSPTSAQSPALPAPTGLWRSPALTPEVEKGKFAFEAGSKSSEGSVGDSAGKRSGENDAVTDTSPEAAAAAPPQVHTETSSQHGLWGAAKASAPKRRWTVQDK